MHRHVDNIKEIKKKADNDEYKVTNYNTDPFQSDNEYDVNIPNLIRRKETKEQKIPKKEHKMDETKVKKDGSFMLHSNNHAYK